MSDWGQGYVTEIPYTYGYYNELLPSSIDFALRSKGFRPPSEGKSELRYLELGCGQGLTANVVAALNPDMSVTAVDFHPGHISGAQALAREAELTNVQFVEADFAEFGASLGRDVQFDYITMHGVLSWVSPQVRSAIIDLVARHLAPGGALLLSYNALPGSSSRAIFHQIFSELASSQAEPASSRVEAGFNLLENLQSASAISLRPHVGKIKNLIEKKKAGNYLAHEYLNEHSQPLFCSQVFDMFRPAKVTFCASADVLSHVDILHLDQPQRRILSRWSDLERRELASDIIRDNGFRKDVLVRGPLALTPLQQRKFWRDQKFALARMQDKIKLELVTTRGQVKLPEDLYRPVLEHFAAGPSTIAEAVQRPSLSRQPLNELIDVVRVYFGMGVLSPVGEASDVRTQSVKRLNDAIIRRAGVSDEIQTLVSPVVQQGLGVSWFDQMMLLSERSGSGVPAEFVWENLNMQGRRFVVDGRELLTEAENISFAVNSAEESRSVKRPFLARLGIADLTESQA